MNSFDFIPLTGIGNVVFGENRENVRNKLGAFQEFRKSRISKNTTDDFGFCHVYYDLENKCEAVEFTASESAITWNGHNISSFNYCTLEKLAAEYDDEIVIDDSGFTSKKIQMGVYSPDKKVVESILLSRDGYYE